MVLLIFIFGVLLALGLFFIMADLLKLPRLATQRAMLSVGRQEKKQARSVEALLMGWAVKLAPHIHMDEYKRGRLKNTLAAAGLGTTPEEYAAFAIVKTSAVLLAVIPCLLIFPLLALVVVLLAVAVYFKEIRRAEEKLSVKRDEIEAELPRFVATITQELGASRDVLSIGNTTATLDELYVWLSDNVSVGTTIIEYIRNTLKRVRKKESNLIMASQNLEDFDREGIRELTKPLFAIPPHQFIFNCGSIDKRFYMDLLQLEEAEYNLIRFPQRGVCLFKCGNERYLLEVHAPTYKEALFGSAGGR